MLTKESNIPMYYLNIALHKNKLNSIKVGDHRSDLSILYLLPLRVCPRVFSTFVVYLTIYF